MKCSTYLACFITLTFVLFPALADASQPPAWGRRSKSAGSDIPDSSGWTVQQAVANMRVSNKRLRIAALRRLAKERSDNAQKWIADAARNDPEPRIRFEAVNILKKRREKASIPILEHIAANDRDARVKKAAQDALIEAKGKIMAPPLQPSGRRPAKPAEPIPPPPPPGVKAGQRAQPQPGRPPQPQPAKPAAQPAQPAAQKPPEKPPEPEKTREVTVNKAGHELPPGYEDEWAALDEEQIVDEKDETVVHHGFMPVVGIDGTMGAPRDTLARTSAGLIVGIESGTYTTLFRNAWPTDTDRIEADNKFTTTDFSLVLSGRYSPIDFFEVGIDAEVLTYESLTHKQHWYQVESDGAFEPLENPVLYNDAGYKGAAFGLVAANIKVLFARTEAFRMGLAVRATFPSHTGDRFDSGIGASNLYYTPDVLPLRKTQDGLLWGVEPGLIASFVPVDHLTLFTDLNFMLTILQYKESNVLVEGTSDRDATNLYLVPHLGAQYRVLANSLGFQVALQPVVYLGKVADPALASFGIVPGVLYRIADLIDVSLTANIEIGDSAADPFICTGSDLVIKDSDDGDEPTRCGVGRRFGMALGVSYDF